MKQIMQIMRGGRASNTFRTITPVLNFYYFQLFNIDKHKSYPTPVTRCNLWSHYSDP